MTDSGLTVYVNQLEIAEEVSQEDVERAVAATAKREGLRQGEFSVTFVDASTIANLNESHLRRQGPTDVIAFQLGEPDRPLGDVYICPEVARESAVEYDVEPRSELLRLVVHGMLHVLGYDHPEGTDRADSEMFRRQEEILVALTRPS